MITRAAESSTTKQAKSLSLPRIMPFAIFMGFIALEEALRWLTSKQLFVVSDLQLLYLYPIKILATIGCMLYFWKSYQEINWRDLARFRTLALSIATGIIVFILWINMDWPWATLGTPKGYNPTLLSDNFTRTFLLTSRIIGASLVVPVMEELFWRSWLLRYLIEPDISRVPLGSFTWISFSIGTVMFGLEHNLWLAGIMAGAAYSVLLYRSKSLATCILAHGITNAALAGYVLWSGEWGFW